MATRRSLLAATAFAAFALQAPAVFAQDRTTVTFAAATFAEAGRGEKLTAWIQSFNDSQDAVTVEPVAIPFSTFSTTIFTQLGGGGGPDLIRFDLIDYFAAAAAGSLADITDPIAAGGYDFSSPDQYMMLDGRRFGVAFEISNFALMYNPELMPDGAGPATFEEFLEYAKRATEGQTYGYGYRATMAERVGFWFDLCNYVYGFGGRWSDEQGSLTLNSPEVVEGVAAYKAVYDAGITPKGTDAATYRRMFWEGNLALELANGGIASIAAAQSNHPIDVVNSPFPTRAQGVILAPVTVNANSEKQDAALTFLEWMLQDEQQAALQDILGASNGAIPVPRSAAALEAAPWLKVFDEQTANGVPQLVLGHEEKTPELQQIILDQVLKVLVGDEDPQTAMDLAQRLGERAISR